MLSYMFRPKPVIIRFTQIIIKLVHIFFSSSLCVQARSGAHPPSYPIDIRGKARLGCATEHSPPSTAEIKNE
jgi:hypothetical protein